MWIEVAVVLTVAVVPDIVNAILGAFDPHPPSDIVRQSIGVIDRSVRVGAAILFIMWRCGQQWSEFGIKPIRWFRDPAAGLLIYLFAELLFIATFASGGRSPFGFSALPAEHVVDRPTDVTTWVLVVVVGVLNGFAEELAMRGFLIPRLCRLCGSTFVAVLVTTLLATLYHVYQSGWGIYSAALFNIAAGISFAATRRLWPVVIAHMLGDIVPFLLW